MEAHPTIIASKSAFLNTQIRLLSAVLSPSSQALSQLSAYDDGPSTKAIEEVMDKVNAKIKSHNDSVYTPETTRHVAGQIDALYWNEVNEMPRPGEGDETLVERRKDLTDPATIATLPPTFTETFLRPPTQPSPSPSPPPSSPTNTDTTSSPSSQYTTLLSRLQTLSSDLSTAQSRLASYQHLSSLLSPLRNPTETIQPNLATKGGELERELERMRVLAARVGSAVERKKREQGGQQDGAGEMEVDGNGQGEERGRKEQEREKVARLWDGL